jgi:hypothetical protein
VSGVAAADEHGSGELAESVDANLIIGTLIVPLYVRLLLTGDRLMPPMADHVAELVAAGAGAAQPLTTGRKPQSKAR